MPAFDDRWHPARIAAFLAVALLLYAGLFLWSGKVLEAHGDRNPFLRIERAPARTGWIILGASHALPLGFEGVPDLVREATGQQSLVLAVAGGGPAVSRLVAERYFADRGAQGVLVLLDTFAFADRRWNEGRIGDADMLPKIPADGMTLRALARAVPRGLPVETFLAYATGFARINDQTRFEEDRWDAEDRFDSTPRPSSAADAERITYLFPGPPSQVAIERALTDLRALIGIAQFRGARVVLVYPPLPERFRAAMPDLPILEERLAAMAGELDVALIDHRDLIPEPRFYFDTDHLNRAGVELWLAKGLGEVLRAAE